MTSRQKCGDYAEALAARHFAGDLAPVNNTGFDLACDALGKIEVKARSLASHHLNWYHTRGVQLRRFDHLLTVELAEDWTVIGAWLLTYDQVLLYRLQRADGQLIEPTKLSIRRDRWKQAAQQIDLAATQAAIH